LTQPFYSDTDKSIAMEMNSQHHKAVSSICAAAISIRIGIIRIIFEQHAGA
jgi:hypothetical protein